MKRRVCQEVTFDELKALRDQHGGHIEGDYHEGFAYLVVDGRHYAAPIGEDEEPS